MAEAALQQTTDAEQTATKPSSASACSQPQVFAELFRFLQNLGLSQVQMSQAGALLGATLLLSCSAGSRHGSPYPSLHSSWPK